MKMKNGIDDKTITQNNTPHTQDERKNDGNDMATATNRRTEKETGSVRL